MSSVARVLRTSVHTRAAPASARSATSSARAAFGRRAMSSSANAGGHSAHGSGSGSDTMWMVGSAVIFGPAFVYLLSPAARKPAHHVVEVHESHRGPSGHDNGNKEEPPMKDDEGTEVSGKEIKESMGKAFDADSPKDAQGAEEKESKGESSEGDEKQAQEGEQQQEEKKDEGEGEKQEAQTKNDEGEQKEDGGKKEPGETMPGVAQTHNPEEQTLTSQGEARKQSKKGEDPKTADPKTDA